MIHSPMSEIIIIYVDVNKMSTGLSSPLGVAAIILIIIGIVMAVIGVILLLLNQNKPKPWYIWVFLIGGVVLGIAGGIMLAIALSQKPTIEHTTKTVAVTQ